MSVFSLWDRTLLGKPIMQHSSRCQACLVLLVSFLEVRLWRPCMRCVAKAVSNWAIASCSPWYASEAFLIAWYTLTLILGPLCVSPFRKPLHQH